MTQKQPTLSLDTNLKSKNKIWGVFWMSCCLSYVFLFLLYRAFDNALHFLLLFLAMLSLLFSWFVVWPLTFHSIARWKEQCLLKRRKTKSRPATSLCSFRLASLSISSSLGTVVSLFFLFLGSARLFASYLTTLVPSSDHPLVKAISQRETIKRQNAKIG